MFGAGASMPVVFCESFAPHRFVSSQTFAPLFLCVYSHLLAGPGHGRRVLQYSEREFHQPAGSLVFSSRSLQQSDHPPFAARG